MSTSLVSVPESATVATCCHAMVDSDVGSVLVTVNRSPVGIVTETDVLHANCTAGVPVNEISATDVMSRPLYQVAPAATARKIAAEMHHHGVKKLVVVEDLDVVGIVTLTDLVWHLSDIRREASALAEEHYRWEH